MPAAPHSSDNDTFPYPSGSVVGVVPDDPALESAGQRLEQAGFDAEHYDVLHGDEGLARLDAGGEQHGTGGSLIRRVQVVVTDEGDHVRRYAEHLREGHYVVGVDVGEDEAAKTRAADALHAAGAEFVNYYAADYFEDLDA